MTRLEELQNARTRVIEQVVESATRGYFYGLLWVIRHKDSGEYLHRFGRVLDNKPAEYGDLLDAKTLNRETLSYNNPAIKNVPYIQALDEEIGKILEGKS